MNSLSRMSVRPLLWIVGSVMIIMLLIRLDGLTAKISLDLGWLDGPIDGHDELVGAFIGALAAPLGIVVTDKVRERRNRDHQRHTMHYNCLIRLQWQLNLMRATLEDNLSIIQTIINANDKGVPTLQRPVQVIIDPSPFNELYDLKLVSMLNQLYYDMRRFNLDMANLTHVQDRLAEEKFSERITAAVYTREVRAINSQIVRLHATLSSTLEHELLDTIAYVRICTEKDATEEMRKRQTRMIKNRPPIEADEIQQVRKTILTELDVDQKKRDGASV